MPTAMCVIMLAIRSGKTYDKSDIATLKLLADGKYRGWHCTAVVNISGNPFNTLLGIRRGLHYNRGQ